jgi:hypothetical protein
MSMKLWLRRFVLLLALAGTPLQGMAAALSAQLCHLGANEHALDIDGIQHESRQDESGTRSHAVDHLCSNLTLSAPSVSATLSAAADFPVSAFGPDPLHDLFVPDRPQRPPLA